MSERNAAAAEAKRRKAAVAGPLRAELLRAYREEQDRTDPIGRAEIAGWWRDPAVLSRLGAEFAALFPNARATVVAAPQSRGSLLGALVATSLGIGLLEVRKNAGPAADGYPWRTRTTPPDYRDRHLRMGFPRRLLTAGERVLFIDDWIQTGGQAQAVAGLVQDAGAHWVGAAVIVDALTDPRLRRDLNLRSLLRDRDL